MDAKRVSFHESGHCVGFWLAGAPVKLLVADDGGGVCVPLRTPDDPASHILACLLGAQAEALSDGHAGSMSVEDHDVILDAALRLGQRHDARIERWYLAQARDLVWLHAEPIRLLAGKLLSAGRLDRASLGSLCWTTDALAPWRSLYPRPAQSKPLAARMYETLSRRVMGRTVRIVTTSRGTYVA